MKWLLVVLALLLIAPPAFAHPAGFASVSRYLGVVCDQDARISIAYVVDFAEMPSVAELDQLDADHDGQSTPDEQAAYLAKRLPPLVAAWGLEVDGDLARPRIVTSKVDVTPGEQGLSTVRITAEVAVDRRTPHRGGDVSVHLRDLVFADRAGWREMAAGDTSEALVTFGPKGQRANALAYGTSPAPRMNDASFTFHLVHNAASPSAVPERSVVVDARLARLSRMMKDASASWTFTLLALALAFALGAVHALSPGHGKTLAAAHLVGRRARPSQALLFGATVTVAHTAVVFVVGCLAVVLERSIGSDRVLRWLELASAIGVLVLGAVQLSRRWREVATGHADHEHSVVALGAAAGLTPCPSALAILLSAIALHRYAFGLLLVLVFSVGVAATLSVVGVLVVLARGALLRDTPRLVRWLPVLSSICVLAIGVLLCVAALES